MPMPLPMVAHFTNISSESVAEHLEPGGTAAIRKHIDKFAARLATTPRSLKANERKLLMQELKASGLLEMKKAMDTVAHHLGVS